jgi:hypothetical protein
MMYLSVSLAVAAHMGGGSEVLVVYGLDVSPGTFFAGTAFDETSITLKACGGGA